MSNIDNIDPRTCIASKMMKCHRILSGVFRKHLLPFGITNSQLSMLFVICKKEQVTQRELCDFLFLEKSTVHRNLTKLLEMGFVTRSNFPNFSMTREGLRFLDQIIPAWQAAMNETTDRLGQQGLGALDLVFSQLKGT